MVTNYVRSWHQDKCHTPLAGQLEDACCLASLVYTVTSSFPVQTIKPPVKREMPQVSGWAHTKRDFPANPGDLATMWCPCGDYRALNWNTVPDCYPVPHIYDFSDSLQSVTIFCKLDMVRAFHKIPVDSADIHKTAITTLLGLQGRIRELAQTIIMQLNTC